MASSCALNAIGVPPFSLQLNSNFVGSVPVGTGVQLRETPVKHLRPRLRMQGTTESSPSRSYMKAWVSAENEWVVGAGVLVWVDPRGPPVDEGGI